MSQSKTRIWNRTPRTCLGMVGLAVAIAVCTSAAQTPTPETPKKERTPEELAALAEGQALFRGLCTGGHVGAGRGGKGPDLTRGKFTHGNKDEDIAKVIRDGVAKTTMKKLGESLK